MIHHLKLLAGTFGAALVAFAAGSAGACALQTVGVLDVDLSRGAPIVDGEINGVRAKIMIDTGSATSLITREAAKGLGIDSGTPGGYVFGIGGQSAAYSTVLKSLKIGSMTAIDTPPFLVGGALQGEPDVAMLIGDDFLRQFDVELDLADHVIRLFQAQGCSPAQLVYWNQPYSQAALEPAEQIITLATLDGARIRAAIDTGASTSLVDAGFAAGLGEPNPAHPELVVTGLGPEPRQAWVDDFASFGVGDEQIAHARIQVSPFGKDFTWMDTSTDSRIGRRMGSPSMLIGEDFLHAHRVMVDYADHVMVFSYNGGPIFSTK